MPEQEQAALFPNTSVPDEYAGYRGPTACQAAGITYRQLDYWARRCSTATRMFCKETPVSSSRLTTRSTRMSLNE